MNVILHLGDCLEYMRGMDAASVDAIITDPPYPKEFIPQYPAWWAGCDRVLKDGGLVIAMVGQYCLPEVINSFPSSWEYIWTGCFEQRQMAVSIWPRGISSAWKPFLIYGKGFNRFKPWKYDVIAARGGYKGPKEFHEWGQDAGQFKVLLERFDIRGVVFDPLMGSGTTGVACVETQRDFIGCEIDPESFATAQRRIAEAQLQIPLDMGQAV